MLLNGAAASSDILLCRITYRDPRDFSFASTAASVIGRYCASIRATESGFANRKVPIENQPANGGNGFAALILVQRNFPQLGAISNLNHRKLCNHDHESGKEADKHDVQPPQALLSLENADDFVLVSAAILPVSGHFTLCDAARGKYPGTSSENGCILECSSCSCWVAIV